MFILKRVFSVQPRRVSVKVLCKRPQDSPQTVRSGSQTKSYQVAVV